MKLHTLVRTLVRTLGIFAGLSSVSSYAMQGLKRADKVRLERAQGSLDKLMKEDITTKTKVQYARWKKRIETSLGTIQKFAPVNASQYIKIIEEKQKERPSVKFLARQKELQTLRGQITAEQKVKASDFSKFSTGIENIAKTIAQQTEQLSSIENTILQKQLTEVWQVLTVTVLVPVNKNIEALTQSLQKQYQEIDVWARESDFTGLVGNLNRLTKTSKTFKQQFDEAMANNNQKLIHHRSILQHASDQLTQKFSRTAAECYKQSLMLASTWFDYLSKFLDNPKTNQRVRVGKGITELFKTITDVHDQIIYTFGIKQWLSEKINGDIPTPNEGGVVYQDLLDVFHAIDQWE